MHGEHALDPFAIGDFAHGEVLVQPAASAPDADALIGLNAGAVALDDLDIDAERVSRPKLRHLPLLGKRRRLLLFELLDDIHNETFPGRLPGLMAFRRTPFFLIDPELILRAGSSRKVS